MKKLCNLFAKSIKKQGRCDNVSSRGHEFDSPALFRGTHFLFYQIGVENGGVPNILKVLHEKA